MEIAHESYLRIQLVESDHILLEEYVSQEDLRDCAYRSEIDGAVLGIEFIDVLLWLDIDLNSLEVDVDHRPGRRRGAEANR